MASSFRVLSLAGGLLLAFALPGMLLAEQPGLPWDVFMKGKHVDE